MTRDRDTDLDGRGPGPDDIPDPDPRYEDTDPGEFKQITRDNLKGKDSLIDNPEDSEELDK
ncbi:hypothetical protein [Saccharibacillus alkalitolerans]|uniref:Uncharacterized protein n=1 Tax=Saccharibacillus alkalitolerans TaxID=2705290 RepID=A0ABX0F2S4_9BACL|nr:hypothetical protein [Saccharibacillus alkalitolerans]NGZ73919.1 hypothetical protein [Saccharibacillus alkalitolerans]